MSTDSSGYPGIDPDNPGNPGSRGHPHDCKPCNKYNPNRPNDSCKHALTCNFCHGKEHERPKHRGQRGRHALQRRQFLEARDSMNPDLRDIVDEVYAVPPSVMEATKQLLVGLDTLDREDQVQLLVEDIARIGDMAQQERPDSQRVHGARMEVQEYTAASDLDGRFKWLTGTLHLMVRKMWDDESKSEEQRVHEIKQKVSDILQQCQRLPEELQVRLQRVSCSSWVEGTTRELLGSSTHTWVGKRLVQLAKKQLNQDPRERVEESLKDVINSLEQLPSLVDGSYPLQLQLLSCQSLDRMKEKVPAVREQILDKLMSMDSLDDLENGHLLNDGPSCGSEQVPQEELRFA
eukprot:TRINITY_DN108808_c0_g1_i1.p1 TRINITY_DN108808_c0_g1~~TRINITY_DN108808_c0_g1_i1.p1  ORF type:complete len:348 (-),score=55.63 TRINITY_DN108808_c0_g1_i1:248-1291(-)